MTGPGSRSADPADGHGHGAVGPLVDEAALLLTAVEDKLQAWQAAEGRMAGGAVELPEPCPECGTVPGAACTGCPVCRLIAAVRGERPEVTARVVDGALTIVRALRTLLPDPVADTGADADRSAAPSGPHGGSADGRPAGPATSTRADPTRTRHGDGADRVPTGPADQHDGRPGAATPSRPTPRAGRATGLQRIDIS